MPDKVISGRDMVELLEAVRLGAKYGAAQTCYNDVLKWAAGELADLEAELQRKPDDPLVLGNIMMVHKVISTFEGAPPHYRDKAEQATREALRKYVGAGLLGEKIGSVLTSALEALTAKTRK